MNNTSCTPARAHGNEVFDQRGRVPSPRTVCLASLAPPKHSSEGSCTERSKKSSCKEFMPVAFASHVPWLDLPTPKPCQRRAVGFFYLLDTGSEMQRRQKPLKKRICRTFYCGAERRKNRSSPTACRHETTPRCWDLGHRLCAAPSKTHLLQKEIM